MKRVAWVLAGLILFVLLVSTIGSQAPWAQAQEPVEPAPPAETGELDPGVPEEIGGVPEEISDVPGVTGVWWATVQEQIRRDMYKLNTVEEDDAPLVRGHNLAHNFDLTFADGGLQLAAGQIRPDPKDVTPESMAAAAETGPDWQWSLRLTGYGYQGRVRPLPAPAHTSAADNRLEYRRAGLSEYYINDEFGLEQGFTLETPPPGAGDGHASQTPGPSS